MLLKMVLYQRLKGQHSPATWHKEAQLNEAMQWLGRGYLPSRRAWYNFRDRVGDTVEQLHRQLISRAIEQNLLDPTIGVQDGTFVAACASRHRMVCQTTLHKRQQQLSAVMNGTNDAAEEIPRWVPPTEVGRLDLADRMETAAEILTQRIEKNQAKPKSKRKDPAKILVSLTDPIAPLGRDKLKVFRPLYTIQYVVAPGSHLIMSYSCEAAVGDTGTLAPMIDLTKSIVGDRLQTMLADAAYCTILDLRDCHERNVELLAPVQANALTSKKQQAKGESQIPHQEFTWNAAERTLCCPAGHRMTSRGRERKQRHGGRTLFEHRYECAASHCQVCPLAKKCLRSGSSRRTIKRLEGQELLDSQREKMKTEEAQARYALRGQTVERGFADARGNRRLDRFHGRGLRRARTETGLLVLAQNILMLDRLEQQALTRSETTT